MDFCRDRNGKTEDEFLRDYDVSEFFRPSVTVDAVLFDPDKNGLKILLIKRGGHPFLGYWAFPGGFVEKDESCETAVRRELSEETGVDNVKLRQLVTVSTPDRDPRCRNITVVFCGIADAALNVVGGDDADCAKWFYVKRKLDGDCVTLEFSDGTESFCSRLKIVRDDFGVIDINRTSVAERGKLAFDHAKVVAYLLDAYEKSACFAGN